MIRHWTLELLHKIATDYMSDYGFILHIGSFGGFGGINQNNPNFQTNPLGTNNAPILIGVPGAPRAPTVPRNGGNTGANSSTSWMDGAPRPPTVPINGGNTGANSSTSWMDGAPRPPTVPINGGNTGANSSTSWMDGAPRPPTVPINGGNTGSIFKSVFNSPQVVAKRNAYLQQQQMQPKLNIQPTSNKYYGMGSMATSGNAGVSSLSNVVSALMRQRTLMRQRNGGA